MSNYIYNQISIYIIIYVVKIYCILFGDEDFLEIMMKGTVCNKLNSDILFCCRSVATGSHGFETPWHPLALGSFGSGQLCSCFLLPLPWWAGTSQVSRPPLVQSPNVIYSLYFKELLKINLIRVEEAIDKSTSTK